MVSEIAHDSDPEPVPASMTVQPSFSPNLKTMAELSMWYKICVFLARVSVIRVDLGLRGMMVFPGLLKA